MKRGEVSRRPSRELRPLVVRAARELFIDHGFAATTTKDIAARAGVTESVLFRHFRSKDDLFEVAVYTPFIDLMDQFVARWDALEHDAVDPFEHGRLYIRELYDLCTGNRDLLRLITTARPAATKDDGNPQLPMARHLADMQGTLERFLSVDGGTTIDLGVAVRLAISLVLGAAVFDRDMFGSDSAGPDDLAEHLFPFILEGVRYAPPESGPPGWYRRADPAAEPVTQAREP